MIKFIICVVVGIFICLSIVINGFFNMFVEFYGSSVIIIVIDLIKNIRIC